MSSEPVTSDDIFSCRQCGDCCKGYGGTYVTEKDILTISRFLKIAPDRFSAHYCRMSAGKPLLAQGKDGYCVFWDKRCTIHPVKPRMCRSWPFIKSVLVDIGNWKVMSAMCPGIRADFPDEVIRECVARELAKNGPS